MQLAKSSFITVTAQLSDAADRSVNLLRFAKQLTS